MCAPARTYPEVTANTNLTSLFDKLLFTFAIIYLFVERGSVLELPGMFVDGTLTLNKHVADKR